MLVTTFSWSKSSLWRFPSIKRKKCAHSMTLPSKPSCAHCDITMVLFGLMVCPLKPTSYYFFPHNFCPLNFAAWLNCLIILIYYNFWTGTKHVSVVWPDGKVTQSWNLWKAGLVSNALSNFIVSNSLSTSNNHKKSATKAI